MNTVLVVCYTLLCTVLYLCHVGTGTASVAPARPAQVHAGAPELRPAAYRVVARRTRPVRAGDAHLRTRFSHDPERCASFTFLPTFHYLFLRPVYESFHFHHHSSITNYSYIISTNTV